MAARKSTRTTKAKASPGGRVVAADGSAMEFRKTNDAIGFRVTEGRLTLLMRKLLNVMMFHAQQLRVPGQNAPIQTPTSGKYFWIPLGDAVRDAAYDSKDTTLLKSQLNELQNVRVQMEDSRQWTSEVLLSSVTFVNPDGLNNRTPVWMGFAFPPELHELVTNPSRYTRFSLVYQGFFKSGAALSLYEICRQYATNPSKLTFSESPEDWHARLSGGPVSGEPMLYKYFKRDVLRPAIAEINALTDIQIELIEHKVGLRVQKIQFRVERAKQPQLEFPAPPVIDVELMEKIMALGVSQHDAGEILAEHGDATVRSSLEIVQSRSELKNSPPLESPAAYFRWALRNAQSVSSRAIPAPKAKRSGAAFGKGAGSGVLERFLTARAEDALGLFMELSEQDQDALVERCQAVNTSRRLKFNRAMDKPMARAVFSRWYAQDLWGDPTAEALAAFVEAETGHATAHQ